MGRGRLPQIRSASATPILQSENRAGHQAQRLSTLANEICRHDVNDALYADQDGPSGSSPLADSSLFNSSTALPAVSELFARSMRRRSTRIVRSLSLIAHLRTNTWASERNLSGPAGSGWASWRRKRPLSKQQSSSSLSLLGRPCETRRLRFRPKQFVRAADARGTSVQETIEAVASGWRSGPCHDALFRHTCRCPAEPALSFPPIYLPDPAHPGMHPTRASWHRIGHAASGFDFNLPIYIVFRPVF